MTNLPPSDPRSSQRTPLGFDEFIGILIAFITIGSILFWSISRKNEGFKLGSLFPSPSPSAQPTQTPTPGTTASPTPISPVPTVTSTELPLLTPFSPSPTPVQPGIRGVVPLPAPVPAPVQPSPAPAPTPAQKPSPAPAQPINFVDVPKDFWASPFIDALSARGIVNGFTGRYFRPNQLVNRAEFATILQAAFEKNTVGQKVSQFKDVPSDFWAAPAIDRATTVGFLKGYPGDLFQPTQPIPRVQALVALATGLNLATKSLPTKTLQSYQDAAQIPSYATDKIAAATEAGLVINYPEPKLLNPNKNATRAEVAAMVYQALVQAGKAKPIESQYIVHVNP